MLTPLSSAVVVTLAWTELAMAQIRIVMSSAWGTVTAELVDNEATRALVAMLPVTIAMRDHLRQEKTGDLPSPLPEVARQTPFAKGTLGLWSADHFVIYYRAGRVPQPGSSSSGKCPMTSRSSIGRVRSPCGWSARSKGRL